MKIDLRRLAVGAAVALAGLFVGALVATLILSAGDRVAKGVTVSGIPVGGLTKAGAGGVLRAWARERAAERITLTALDSRWNGAMTDLGARVEWRRALADAFAVGRKGNIFNRIICMLTSRGAGKKIEARIAVDPAVVKKAISKVARVVNRPHRDARLAIAKGSLVIEQDARGIKLDEKQTGGVITRALVAGRSMVPLPIEVDRPEVTARDAAKIDTVLGSFSTFFHRGQRDRTHNLTLAAKAISGRILKPETRFSMNETVGPRISDRGFRNAPIFVSGKIEPGLGGGVCQVSSTLYNAVLLAGLTVLERNPHSRTVPYVSPGRDATVAYGLQDFEFANSNPSPVGIITRIDGGRLTVELYGDASDRKQIRLFTSRTKYTSVARKATVDPSVPAGHIRVLDKGARGVGVTLYRKITRPDGTSVTEVVSQNRYPARPAVVAVGPGRKQPAAPHVVPVGASGAQGGGAPSRSD